MNTIQLGTRGFDLESRHTVSQAFGTFVLNYLPLIIKNKITIQRPFTIYIVYIIYSKLALDSMNMTTINYCKGNFPKKYM